MSLATLTRSYAAMPPNFLRRYLNSAHPQWGIRKLFPTTGFPRESRWPNRRRKGSRDRRSGKFCPLRVLAWRIRSALEESVQPPREIRDFDLEGREPNGGRSRIAWGTWVPRPRILEQSLRFPDAHIQTKSHLDWAMQGTETCASVASDGDSRLPE